MTDSHLERIQSDLITIRTATGIDSPHTEEDWKLYSLLAIGGIAFTVVTAFTGVEARLALFLCQLPAVICFVTRARTRRANRAKHPVLWRDIKLSLVVGGISIPAMLVFVYWQSASGMGMANAKSATMFFVGLACLLAGICHRQYRELVAIGLVFVAGSPFLPWLAYWQILIVSGIAMAVVGFVGAGINWYYFHRHFNSARRESLTQ